MQFEKVHNKRVDSVQFKLSQKIFAWRISHNLTRSEAAKLVQISIDNYTKIEQGIWQNANDYELVLRRIKNNNIE